MIKATRYLLLISAVVLSSCTMTPKMMDNVSSIPQGRGVVIFSTGAAETSLSASTFVALVDGATHQKFGRVSINIDYPFASDFPSEHANVRSFTLPAGEYYLVPNGGGLYLCVYDYPVYKFVVKNAAISYVGNIYKSAYGLNWSDKYASRDIDFFKAKNKNLNSDSIEIQKVEKNQHHSASGSCAGSDDFIKGTNWDYQ
jgi:hypothetical protein